MNFNGALIRVGHSINPPAAHRTMIRRNPITKGARHCRAPIRIAELNLQLRKHYASIFKTRSRDADRLAPPGTDLLGFSSVDCLESGT